MNGVLYLSEIEFKIGLRGHYYIVLTCRGKKTDQPVPRHAKKKTADPFILPLPCKHRYDHL